MALRLLLVRHGETEWNVAGRLQGQCDVPLSERGERQARALRARLESEAIDAVYASDLSRARRTAEIAVDGRRLAVTCDPAWREISFGEWDGLDHNEVSARDASLAERRFADPANTAAPGGETLEDVRRRVVPAAERLRLRHDGKTVLLVAHGGSIRVLVCDLLGIDLNHAWRLESSNAGVSCLRWYEALPVLELWNDVGHLRGV